MRRRVEIGLLTSLLTLAASSGLGQATPSADPTPADKLLASGRTLYLEEGPGPALPAYEKALAAYRQESNRLGEAITIGLIGNCHKRFGDYDRALELLGSALEIKRQLGERAEEGTTLSHLGLVYWEMGDYPQAIDSFQASSKIGDEIGDAELQGINLNNLSLVYDELGDYRRSLEGYERALEIYRRVGFARGESDTLGNIGGVHLLLGRYGQAESFYQQSLAISEREELIYSMSLDHGNLALAMLGRGRTREALAHFDRALELAEQAGATQDEGFWLKGKGEALVTLGRVDEGLDLLRRSVERSEATESTAEMIEALNELGELYARLGDTVQAEAQLRRAVDASRRIGLERGVTFGLLALGDLEWRRGRHEQATALYKEVLRRAEAAGEQSHMAESLLRLARTHRTLSLLDDAATATDRALKIARKAHARPIEAEALYARGEVERLGGHTDLSLESLVEAEAVAIEVGTPDFTWRVKHAQGLALEQAGRLGDAAGALEQAVAMIESIRNRLYEERFRAGYMQDKYQVYVDLVRVLLAADQTEQAFASAERLRARSYLELIHRGMAAGDEGQRQREIELRERVRQLQRAIAEERSKGDSEYRQRAVSFFSAELEAAESEYQTLLDDLRRTDPRAADLRVLTVPTASRVQASLPSDSALLEYLVDDDMLIIFVLTSDSVRTLEVPVTRRSLEARVELLSDLILRTGSEAWRRPARALADALVSPALELGWLDGIDRLFVVPHGVLHYVPFGALALSDDRLLVQVFDLSVLPAAAMITGTGTELASTDSVLALAPARAGLRFAPDEVRSVGQHFGSDSMVLVGDRARESTFKRLAGQYRVLHLASHGYFNKLNPLLSGLELEADAADDGYLEVHEIMNLELAAELVTLSACETGLASGHFAEVPSGEEFVGLTRAFLSAGSGAVLSTLWRINDRSTVAMMEGFYQNLNGGERSGRLAAALAQAQRAMLRGGRYAHPYYWGSFTLVGAERNESTATAETSDPGP